MATKTKQEAPGAPEVRRIETPYYETGGGPSRVDVTYEVGAVIDGKWVRFASVSQGTVDGLPTETEKADAETGEGAEA